MFFIPYGHVEIKSSLPPNEVEHRLQAQIDPYSIFSGAFRRNHKYFQGSLAYGYFKISRIVNGKNSFAPVIIGKIQPDINGTSVDFILRLDYFVIIFSCIFLSSILFIFVVPGDIQPMLSQGFSEDTATSLLILLEGCLAYYLFVMIPFNIEAGRAITYLQNLIEDKSN